MLFSKCLRAKIYCNMNGHFDAQGCQTLLLKESELFFIFGLLDYYARSAQLGPIRTRLCGPRIAAKAGLLNALNCPKTRTGTLWRHEF